MTSDVVSELVAAACRGELRATARLATFFEDTRAQTADRREEALNGLRAFSDGAGNGLRAFRGPGVVLGITGSPGAGKSSLISALMPLLMERSDARVAVIAVDPSSTLSGGSLLGDRTRMSTESERTFFRSQAAASTLGGLAETTFEVCRALEHLFDLILVETVGVGQSESAVRALASRLYLVMQPGAGDRVQHMKAGIIELPDVFVMNKCDLEGGATSAGALRASLRLGSSPGARVIDTSARTGTGVAELCDDVLSAVRSGGPGCVAAEPAFFRAWVERTYGRVGLDSLGSRPNFMETAGGYDAGKRSFGVELLAGSLR